MKEPATSPAITRGIFASPAASVVYGRGVADAPTTAENETMEDLREIYLALVWFAIGHDVGCSSRPEAPMWNRIRHFARSGPIEEPQEGNDQAVKSLADWMNSATCELPPEEWAAARRQVEEELRRADALGARFTTIFDHEYPRNLRSAPSPPPFLFYRGVLNAELDAWSVAVAGRHNDDPHDLRRSEHMGRQLSKLGVTVVSGVMGEINRVALRAAIGEGGRAIVPLMAALGPGYRGHGELCDDVVDSGGAIVSRHWPTHYPTSYTFRPHNQLAVQISKGIVVVGGSGTQPDPRHTDVGIGRIAVNITGIERCISEARHAAHTAKPVFVLRRMAETEQWAKEMIAAGEATLVNRGEEVQRNLRRQAATAPPSLKRRDRLEESAAQQGGASSDSASGWRVPTTAGRTMTLSIRRLARVSTLKGKFWFRTLLHSKKWTAGLHYRIRTKLARAWPTLALRRRSHPPSSSPENAYRPHLSGTAPEDGIRESVKIGSDIVLLTGRKGCWTLDNEEELRVLFALRGGRRTAGRDKEGEPGDFDPLDLIQLLLEPLNARLLEMEGIPGLHKHLRAIAEAREVCLVDIPPAAVPAVAYACAHWSSPKGKQWLLWALATRLEHNLDPRVGPGPGIDAAHNSCSLDQKGFGRDATWMANMPSTFWDRIRNHPDPTVRRAAVASNPSASPQELKELAEVISRKEEMNESAAIADLLASNPNTAEDTQLKLAADWDYHALLLRILQNRQTPARLLHHLANSRKSRDRAAVARHPEIPTALLDKLSTDCEQVRIAVARNPRTPPKALSRLARDPEVKVRKVVAGNSAAPPEAVEALLNDRSSKVRETVAQTHRDAN